MDNPTDHQVLTPLTSRPYERTVQEENNNYASSDIRVIHELEDLSEGHGLELSKGLLNADGSKDSTYYEPPYGVAKTNNNIYPKPIEESGKTKPCESELVNTITMAISGNMLSSEMVVCHSTRVMKKGSLGNDELLVQLYEYERFKLHRTT